MLRAIRALFNRHPTHFTGFVESFRTPNGGNADEVAIENSPSNAR
jgi:hypothetical protein